MVDTTRIMAMPESDLNREGTWALGRVSESLKNAPEHRKAIVERALMRDPRVRGTVHYEIQLVERRRALFEQIGRERIETLRAKVERKNRKIRKSFKPDIERAEKKIADLKKKRGIDALRAEVEKAESHNSAYKNEEGRIAALEMARGKLALESGYVNAWESGLNALKARMESALEAQDKRMSELIEQIHAEVDSHSDITGLITDMADRYKALGIKAEGKVAPLNRCIISGESLLRPSISSELRGSAIEAAPAGDVAFR